MVRFLRNLAFSFILTLPLAAQYYPGYEPNLPRARGTVPDAVASIDGIFKSADKKFVEVQVESGDIMRMYITRNTRFIRDGKPVKSSEFHDGDKVTADASRDVRMNMLAVKIELKKPGETKPTDDKPKEDKPSH